MRRKTFIVLLLLVAVLFAFVSCNGSVVPEDRTGAIFLGDNERSIGTAVTYTDDVENLYWYYKATKNDDGYRTGATDGYVSVVKDSSGNPAKGLSGKTLASDGFSYGYWNIELRGYSSTDDGSTESKAKYTASITNFLVKDSMNYATVEIKVGDDAATSIVFGDIWFSADNIETTSTFALEITDTNDADEPVTKGTVTVNTEGTDAVSLESGKITFKNITYSATADEITGNHVMTFTLMQTLKPSTDGTNANSTTITAAVYTLKFNVLKGTTTTISGDMLKSDKTGDIQINGSLSVPATTLKKVIPVNDDANSTSAEVKTATSISVGDLTVTYPIGAVIVPGDGGYTGEDGNVTSDGSVGFTYVNDSEPTGDGITIETGESSAKYELTLNAGKGTDGTTKNEKLIEIKKYIGLNVNITKVYHGTTQLTTTTSETCEYYKYDASAGYLYLYVFHASDFYIITKTPEKYVAQVGSAKYTNANAAFNDAKRNNDKVTILNDCSVERDELPNGVDFDINGKTITVTYSTGGKDKKKVAESTFDGNSTALKYFAGGLGTSSDPFQIADKEQFQNINLLEEYSYFKWTGENTLDAKGWVPVYLCGSFDGRNLKIANLDSFLFWAVWNGSESGEPGEDTTNTYTIENLDITADIRMNAGWAATVVKTVGVDTFVMKNVNVHGYIEGSTSAAFICFGPGNYIPSPLYSYKGNITFKDCHSDMTVVSTSGTATGFIAHAMMSEGATVTLTDSDFTGILYATAPDNPNLTNFKYICGNWINATISDNRSTDNDKLYDTSKNGWKYTAAGKTNTITAENTKKTALDLEVGKVVSIDAVENATKAVVELQISPNPGNMTSCYMKEEVSLNNGKFTSNTIKYFTIRMNETGITESGVHDDYYDVIGTYFLTLGLPQWLPA